MSGCRAVSRDSDRAAAGLGRSIPSARGEQQARGGAGRLGLDPRTREIGGLISVASAALPAPIQ
jgi:hypothetical protein